jgi:hypothetical protein
MTRRLLISGADCDKIKSFCTTGQFPEGLTKSQKKDFKRKARCFSIHGDDLLQLISDGQTRRAVADDDFDMIQKIMLEEHLPDHPGVSVMWAAITLKYVGFGREHAEQFVKHCDACQHHRPLKEAAIIKSIVVKEAWERVQVDCMDMRRYEKENDGFGWILNVIDCHTKFLFSFAMKTKSAHEVVDALKNLFFVEGPPKEIQTDNGKEFVNSSFKALCAQYYIRHVRGRPRHPQSQGQGQVERVNQTLGRKLAKCLHGQGKRWIVKHKEIVSRYNLCWHRAINLTPMMAFRRRPGFNVPAGHVDSGKDMASEETGFVSEKDDALGNSDGSILGEGQCETDSAVEEDSQSPNQASDIAPGIDPNYVKRYVDKTVADASVHFHRLTFFTGDKVLLKRDFDNNPKTK